METKGAVEMFLRSLEKYHLIYDDFVGDGESSSFGNVKEKCFAKYGSLYEVVKEEYVGHVQKRLGTNLRNYKLKKKGIVLDDGGKVGGAGRLTDLIIDKMQNNFGFAIRNNVGDIKKNAQCYGLSTITVSVMTQSHYKSNIDIVPLMNAHGASIGNLKITRRSNILKKSVTSSIFE